MEARNVTKIQNPTLEREVKSTAAYSLVVNSIHI